ncbi:MAG TPA: AGE family epimerase/isomerase [Propionibacteriaceae bacterium]|nr:AGE family epimerase/isomerase [Propionibacteriaceae bacterium]
MPTIASPLDPVALEEEFDRLIAFGRRFPHPGGGAAWLDDDGTPDLTRPIYTWITARMAHIYCLAHIRGVTGADELADSALGGLTGTLRDHQNGGWFSSIHAGTTADEKSCYAHAFVVLAASSAAIADRPGARSLLDEALTVWDQRFFDPDADMFVDSWNAAFSTRSPYRGLNANMHSVEALLAAADATGEQRLRDRATTIGYWVAALAERHGWRMPEHFDPDWQPMLEHNRDKPDDPFQPFGATVGHGLEWSRLLLHLHASAADPAPTRLRDAAVALFDRAVADGWEVDGAPGFVYTTDWDGVPVVRDRMHWVVAEAISAGAALHQVTDDQRYGDLCRLWWDYATRYLMDHQRGSWHHQLDATNSPIATVWPGKPDIYHAAQTTLIPRLPLAPTLALALHQEPTAGT